MKACKDCAAWDCVDRYGRFLSIPSMIGTCKKGAGPTLDTDGDDCEDFQPMTGEEGESP